MRYLYLSYRLLTTNTITGLLDPVLFKRENKHFQSTASIIRIRSNLPNFYERSPSRETALHSKRTKSSGKARATGVSSAARRRSRSPPRSPCGRARSRVLRAPRRVCCSRCLCTLWGRSAGCRCPTSRFPKVGERGDVSGMGDISQC